MRKIDFKDMNLSNKIRDIHNIEKRNFVSINIFGYGEKEKFSIYV